MREPKCLNCPDARLRVSNSGSRRIMNVTVTEHEVILETWNREKYHYAGGRNRWTDSGGALISRCMVEEMAGLWPGYVDCLEDLFFHGNADAWDKRAKLDELVRGRMQLDKLLKREYRRLSKINCKLSKNPETDPPDQLKGIDGIEKARLGVSCYVYFLLNNNKVVYVGQTSQPWPRRILDHIKSSPINFDDVWRLEVDASQLNDVELHYIHHFKPKYNTAGLICRKDAP